MPAAFDFLKVLFRSLRHVERMERVDLNAKLKHYRLNEQEYAKICELMGRAPEGVEWALFSALWSEHCSYKSSRRHLKKFFNRSPRVLQSFGENAGVIDLGEGERVAFKMESHNHPSFIEPYQGAATGVGGILRDIFTMGARPIALADYLCFGDPTAPRMSALVDGVVRGISGYGNCVGVPTVSGQTEFHSSYNQNILVNALAVGLFEPGDPIVTSQASGVGNYVVYVGAKTGRDGVHGASMASEAFGEDSAAENASKRPTVQIGDPFFEKLLIESCLEVIKKGLVVAIQDMGAAGITSSCFEMAAKGGVGFDIHLDQVPMRETGLGPEDILLSESQERMLLICEPKNFEALCEVFRHWDLDASRIGVVTEQTDVTLFWRDEQLCRIDPLMLTDNAPMYDRPYDPWRSHPENAWMELPVVENRKAELMACLRSVQGCSRDWIFEQYDQRVGGRTARDARQSVAVLSLTKSRRTLGLVLGCRPQVMRMDARLGAQDAVFYPALELSLKGFEPLAVTDCLNFGNPERRQVMSEFVATVEGMSEVCEALQTPVISGNVSFYNETGSTAAGEKNVTSTPSTGLVGLRPSIEKIPQGHFQNKDDVLFLWRNADVTHTGQWGETRQGVSRFKGQLRVPEMASWIKAVRETVLAAPSISSARVVGKFGLAATLARMCTEDLGFRVTDGEWASASADWFIERMYEVVLAVPKAQAAAFESLAQKAATAAGSQLWNIGHVVEGMSEFNGETYMLTDLILPYISGWREHFEALA